MHYLESLSNTCILLPFFQVIKIPEHSFAIGLAGRLELNLLLQCKSNLCF